MARQRFSCGPIDGVKGAQTVAALIAFQQDRLLAKTGELDAETKALLFTSEALFVQRTLTPADFTGLQPVSPGWLGKSQQSTLAYETVQERLAEHTHASPTLLKKLNPEADWEQLKPDATLLVPAVEASPVSIKATQLYIRLSERVLQVRCADGRILAHFPVSIAQDRDKRPEGELHVTVVIAEPDYTFDPAVFTESPEAQGIGRN